MNIIKTFKNEIEFKFKEKKNILINKISKVKNNFFDVDFINNLKIKLNNKQNQIKNLGNVFLNSNQITIVIENKEQLKNIYKQLINQTKKYFEIQKKKLTIYLKPIHIKSRKIETNLIIELCNKFKISTNTLIKKYRNKFILMETKKMISESIKKVLIKELTILNNKFQKEIIETKKINL